MIVIMPTWRWHRHHRVTDHHDDVIKWKHFPRYWPFVRGNHRSPVNSPLKGHWRGALMFSLICAWMNDWVNNREAGTLRRHRGHYDVIVMDCGDMDMLFSKIHHGYYTWASWCLNHRQLDCLFNIYFTVNTTSALCIAGVVTGNKWIPTTNSRQCTKRFHFMALFRSLLVLELSLAIYRNITKYTASGQSGTCADSASQHYTVLHIDNTSISRQLSNLSMQYRASYCIRQCLSHSRTIFYLHHIWCLKNRWIGNRNTKLLELGNRWQSVAI